MSQQASFEFADICSNRHKGSATSTAANKRANRNKPQYRYLCLDFIRRNGTATLEDLCKHFDKTPNTLSGRLSELKAANLIESVGVRNGFQIYRAVA